MEGDIVKTLPPYPLPEVRIPRGTRLGRRSALTLVHEC